MDRQTLECTQPDSDISSSENELFLLQTRSLLGVFEKDALMLDEYTKGVHQCINRMLNAQVHRLEGGLLKPCFNF